MSAQWATWQAQLPALFATLLGLSSASACAWETQPRKTIMGLRAQLNVIALPSIGVEDRQYIADDAGTFELGTETVTGTLTEQLTGQRELVLQISTWSKSQKLAASARPALDSMRTRLGWQSTQDALAALDLVFVSASEPLRLDPRQDGRSTSRWSVDVTLAFASVEADTDAPTNWIDSIRLRSDSLRNEGGAPLDSQIDVTVDLTSEA